MYDQIKEWSPPFYIFEAGFGSIKNADYYNDVATIATEPRRVLITQTLKGSGTLYVTGTRFEVKEDDIFVIERPGPYVYCFEEGNIAPWEFKFISIAFTDPGKKDFLPDLLVKNPVMSLKNFPSLRNKLDGLRDIFISVHKTRVLAHSILAYDLLISYIEAKMIGEERTASIYDAAVKLKGLLDTNYMKNLKIQNLAFTLGYSKEALIRSFKNYYGIPPLKYFNRVKMFNASQMLERDDLSVKEIAFATGFENANYFCRIFRSFMGISPMQYRNMYFSGGNVEMYYNRKSPTNPQNKTTSEYF